MPDQASSFTVYGLQPDTDYEFQVQSRNSLGNGSFSQMVMAKTLGKVDGAVVIAIV